MPPAEVTTAVLSEIDDQWHRTNLHHVNLRECLIDPERLTLIDIKTEQPLQAWRVLRECASGDSYGVVYDELSGTFGLGQFAKGYEPCLLGFYGDFFTTLEAM